MIFVTGPMFSGKRTYVRQLTGWSEDEMLDRVVTDVQELSKQDVDLNELADKLANHPIVIATEVGGGVVPVDKAQREARERAGRLACLLAQRAEIVIRMCCGIPEVLKGELK